MKARCDPDGIRRANKILADGGVIVFPTDTVYGIGCSPFNENAVKRVYSLKNRDPAKPLPVLVYSKEVAETIAIFDDSSEKIAARMWPGPMTIVLSLREEKLKKTLGISKKIAVRVPDHRCTLELLSKCRYVVGTSANVSGAKSIIDPRECQRHMGGYDLLLDGGKISGDGESTVIEFVGGKLKIHREGSIRREEILKVL